MLDRLTRLREANLLISDGLDLDEVLQRVPETLTFRRTDGQEVSLKEWPLDEMLSAGETVRVEEIILSVPDGRNSAALINATPIRAEDGAMESCVVTLQDLTPPEEQAWLRADLPGMVSEASEPEE